VFRRSPEPLLTREEVNGLIEIVMRVDDSVERIRQLLEDDDGQEEAEEDGS
jgi:hypothetical protein